MSTHSDKKIGAVAIEFSSAVNRKYAEYAATSVLDGSRTIPLGYD